MEDMAFDSALPGQYVDPFEPGDIEVVRVTPSFGFRRPRSERRLERYDAESRLV